MSDDWWANLYGEPPGGEGANRDALPGEKKHNDTDAGHHALASVSPTVTGVNTRAPAIVPSASHWGSGRTLDPFLQSNPAHGTTSGQVTPEEDAELRKHEEKLAEPKSTPAPEDEERDASPAKDDAPTDTPEPPKSAEEEEEKSWKDRLKDAKAKVGKTTATVTRKTAPARKGTATAFHAISPSKGEPFSFFWSFVAAWVISPMSLVSAADRISLMLGASQPLSGGTEPSEWGFLSGPGVWFREVLTSYMGSDEQSRLVLLALVGIVPVLVAQVADRISSDGARKILMWVGYGFPVFFICAVSYFPAMGFRSWNDLYVTVLFATAWWGFSFSRTVGSGPTQFLLRIPLASIIFGVVSYSPGALF